MRKKCIEFKNLYFLATLLPRRLRLPLVILALTLLVTQPQAVAVPAGAIMQEVLFTPPRDYCVFSTYGTSPESPDRSWVAYTRFAKVPTTDGKVCDAEIWVADSSGGNRRKVADVKNIDPHNGARVDWVDSQTIVHFDDFQTVVRKIDGAVLYKKKGYPGEQVSGTKVLIFHPFSDKTDNGIWILDIGNGSYRRIIDESMIEPFVSRMNRAAIAKPWKITHPRFSPSGLKVGFLVNDEFFSVDVKEPSLPVYFGHAPMHWLWFDDASIYGHTSSFGLGTRYRLSGEAIEILSGKGNHLAISPDRNLFASETNYNSNPIILRLYHRGDMKGQVVFSSPFASAVWSNGKAHVNPSFARDGSRLYYNKPTAPNLMQGCWSSVPLRQGK